MAVASDGSVALLSGSGPMGSQAANAYIFSFYTSAGQYNSCPQEIDVRAAICILAALARQIAFFTGDGKQDVSSTVHRSALGCEMQRVGCALQDFFA